LNQNNLHGTNRRIYFFKTSFNRSIPNKPGERRCYSLAKV